MTQESPASKETACIEWPQGCGVRTVIFRAHRSQGVCAVEAAHVYYAVSENQMQRLHSNIKRLEKESPVFADTLPDRDNL